MGESQRQRKEEIDWGKQPEGWGFETDGRDIIGWGSAIPRPTPREQIVALTGAIAFADAIIDAYKRGIITGDTSRDFHDAAQAAKGELQRKIKNLWSVEDGVKGEKTQST